MYQNSDKRKLYWLIDAYLSSEIDEDTFCDEFYSSFDLKLDHNTLTKIEEKTFTELSEIASRFSKYEDDHKLDARAFSTTEELKQKIIETKEKLRNLNGNFHSNAN